MSFLLFSLTFACQQATHRFSALGQTTVDPDQVIPPTSGNTDEETAEESDVNAEAPVISTDSYAFHDELPQIGPVIEMHILYSDQQDDVHGGVIKVDYYSETQDSYLEAIIDNVEALHENNEITVTFQEVEPNEAYTFMVTVVDANFNESESMEIYATPSAAD